MCSCVKKTYADPGVFEGFSSCDTFRGIDSQHLINQIFSFRGHGVPLRRRKLHLEIKQHNWAQFHYLLSMCMLWNPIFQVIISVAQWISTVSSYFAYVALTVCSYIVWTLFRRNLRNSVLHHRHQPWSADRGDAGLHPKMADIQPAECRGSHLWEPESSYYGHIQRGNFFTANTSNKFSFKIIFKHWVWWNQ